jgi:hypothetical protein
MLRFRFSFLLLLALAGNGLFGQAFTGTITGNVMDPGGASIANATVRARNEATSEVRTQTTSSDGRYNFSQLPPGTYEVTAEMQGFRRSVQKAVPLRVNQTLELNIGLTLGEVNQAVEVTSAVTLLDTQTANRAVTIDQQTVLDLPTNARNPFQLVHVNAGVIAVRTGISQATQDQNHNRFSMNGGRGQAGLTLIDGAPAAAVDWGGLIASPSVDSVAEVNIQRNQFDAQFGKSDGTAVNMITRSGSNKLHGSMFEFLRNNVLDANSWGNNRARLARPVFQRNQFGATMGGAIWKEKKLFFFGAYEGRREGNPATNISSVPTALQRAGDFSQTFNNNGTLSPIFDPFTTRAGAAGGLVRDAFPGNTIPQARFDSVARRVMALYPAANRGGDPFTNARNFAAAGKTITVNDRMDLRIDWARNEKMTMFGRLTKAWQENVAPVFFGNGADTNFSDVNPRHHVVIGTTLTPSPTWVLNVLLGSGRWRENQISPSTGLSPANLGFSSGLVSQLQTLTYPGFSIQGYAGLNNRRFLNAPRETHNLQVNVTKELSSHSLKFGWLGEMARLNNTDFNTPQFDFTRGLTSGPTAAIAATTSGDALASLLLGAGSGGSAPYAAATAVTAGYHGLYLQDSWRATRRLTLHMGIRWEVQPGRTERFNRFNNFDPTIASPLAAASGIANLRGGLVFVDANNRGAWDTDWMNLAPRFGMAYKITDKLVFRGGYGIFYPQSGGGTNQGFSTSTAWVSTVGGDGLNPNTASPLSNPFPQGLVLPAGSSLGLRTQVGETVNAFYRNHPLGYVQNFSADFQYEIRRGMVVEAGFTGSQGRKLLFGAGQQANQLHPNFLAQGDALNAPITNPFFGSIPSGVLAGRTVPAHRLLRPHPQFNGVNVTGDVPGASSSFNAMVLRYNWQLASGLNLLTTYQWSKAIDNASEWQGWEVSDTLRNYYDNSLDRSISAHDLPQSFVNSLVYELPVGKGKKFGSSMGKVANAVAGGWQVSSIVRFGSGLPLGFTAPNTLAAYGFQVQRPNVADLKAAAVDNPTPDTWFNRAAFTRPGTYEIGNMTRWAPNIRFGRTSHADFALLKNFRWAEGWKAQFRAEMFNATNTPQFGRANTDISSGDFGRVSGTTNVGPRNIQLGMRIQF